MSGPSSLFDLEISVVWNLDFGDVRAQVRRVQGGRSGGITRVDVRETAPEPATLWIEGAPGTPTTCLI